MYPQPHTQYNTRIIYQVRNSKKIQELLGGSGLLKYIDRDHGGFLVEMRFRKGYKVGGYTWQMYKKKDPKMSLKTS